VATLGELLTAPWLAASSVARMAKYTSVSPGKPLMDTSIVCAVPATAGAGTPVETTIVATSDQLPELIAPPAR
jgi:hypothetical protein